MEIVLNSDYLPFHETEPQTFEVGGAVDLTNQLTSAIQGYVDLGKLDDAVATSITIDSLPACGALYRETVDEGEEQFAIFWSYDSVEGFVVQAAVGDTIDFGITALFYEGQDDCAELEDQFTYTVMGTVPVQGPTTTTGLQVVETLSAYDGFGLEPSIANGPVMISYDSMPPFGAEPIKCSTKDCDEGEPEVLQLGVEYDAYDGWYSIRTTAACYGDDGQLKDDLWQWLYGAFCNVIPECSGEPTEPQA